MSEKKQALNIWYDKGQTLSFRAFFNLLIGNRGSGKTYSYKTWCIDDFKKTGHQFVWLRRYGTEIEEMRKTFFDDIRHLYPQDKLNLVGTKKSGKILVNNKVAGFYFALTTSAIAKSSAFPLVDKIVFDEFLIMGNTYKYLNDEVVMLLEFIETIFRNRENDPDAVQPRGVYLLGNNITIANPYFLYFNIPNFKGRFYKDKERNILVERYSNERFIENKKNTAIGKLTRGTTYEEYAIENKAYLDNDTFIAEKPNSCSFYCAIDYKTRTYGFWLDYRNGKMYCNMQYDPSTIHHYSLTRDDHTINTFLVKGATQGTYIKTIVDMFKMGLLYFQDNIVKAQMFEVLSYFVR